MKQQENKNVLVTGGLGYIGSHTVIELVKNGFTPFIIDNLSNSYSSVVDGIKKITGKDIFYLGGDLRDVNSQSNVAHIMKNYNIGSVIHFAAHKSVSESAETPLKYYDNNLISTIKLLEHMKKYKVKNIVFSSSCTVYGQPDKYPVTELTPIKPAETPYGETKRMCEQIIESESKVSDINAIILRYFNPIGAHESGLIYENPKGNPENLMPYISDVIDGKYPFLKVFGHDYDTKDGTAIRDYININDLASAHVKALDYTKESNGYEIFNVGSGDGCSVLEILNSFKENGIEVPYQLHPRRSGDIEKIYGDISKAKDKMGWKPTRTIEDSIKSIIKSTKQRKKV